MLLCYNINLHLRLRNNTSDRNIERPPTYVLIWNNIIEGTHVSKSVMNVTMDEWRKAKGKMNGLCET